MKFFKKQKPKEVPEKEDVFAPGWDAITSAFEKLYSEQKNPKHYAPLISWKLGGNDPLDGISIYEGDTYFHFVTYGLSELYQKTSETQDISGYGMEFTFKLQKDKSLTEEDQEKEIRCICGILQSLARITFTKQEVFLPFEYIYTGQKEGIDAAASSPITGFITVPDSKIEAIETPNGKVKFVSFVGAYDSELQKICKKEMTVRELYQKLKTDCTDYHRKCVIE